MSSSRPGHRRQGLLQESGSSRRLGLSPRGLGQLSPKDISPVRGLDRSTPASVPLTDDPARLRPTKSSFRANSASVRADTATPGFGSSKRSLGQQGRPSRGTPTPSGYGSLTRHLCTGRLTLGEAVQTTNKRVLVLENEEKTRLCAKNTYTFRPRQPQ
jgi:hypothetical protein